MPDTGADAAALVLTIDLGALAKNWKRLAELSAPAECAAVVKADAYGIGIDEAVPALLAAGCRTFFVALPEEGRAVRAGRARRGDLCPERLLPRLGGHLPRSRAAPGAQHLRLDRGLGGSTAPASPPPCRSTRA